MIIVTGIHSVAANATFSIFQADTFAFSKDGDGVSNELLRTLSSQIDINGPTGSENFGRRAVPLPNGNIVVLDPLYDAPGAVNAGPIQPPARGEQCDILIIVNRTTDESDDDIQDDFFCPSWTEFHAYMVEAK